MRIVQLHIILLSADAPTLPPTSPPSTDEATLAPRADSEPTALIESVATVRVPGYEARQTGLNRLCALKMILAGRNR